MGELEELKNKYMCTFLIIFIVVFCSIGNPILLADETSSDSLTLYIDRKTNGIYNSEGFFTTDLTSNAVQAAIDHLQTNSGTVWVDGDILVTSTLHPRSWVTINFLGNTLDVQANVPIVSFAQNTLFSIIKNAVISLPEYYDQTVFLLDNNGMGGGSDAIDFNNIENIVINCKNPYQYTGIHMKLDGINEMWNNIFKNIIMNGPKTAIKLEMTSNAKSSVSGGIGFSNGNAFDNILIDSFEYGISFIKPNWYSYGGFNCNLFTNIDFRYSDESRHGITGVYGNGNTFMGISMNNWRSSLDLDYVYQIYTRNIKLYVDQWIDNHILFDAPSNVNVLESNCPADFKQFDYEDSFVKFDFSKRGVHTNNGNFYDQVTSSTIQKAINSIPLTGGFIYINEPALLQEPVYLKSNIILDFLGYRVSIQGLSDGFVFENGVESASIKHTLISGSGGKNQDYILFKLTGSTTEDIIFENSLEYITMEGNGYTGIHFVLDGVSGIWDNHFYDIHLYKSNGIYFEMTLQATSSTNFGWVNGNSFEYICNDEFYKGIEFSIPSIISNNDKAGFNCNLFKHVLYQIEPNSNYGIIDISGDSNTFMHVIFWDNLYGAMVYFMKISNQAEHTKIWADWDEDQCYDSGINTIIEEGTPFFDSSGFYWEESIIRPITSFFLFPLFSKIISLFPMLQQEQNFFFKGIFY